jgi:hypothetical protein
VVSLRGIRAYDELQKLLQPKLGKSNRRLQQTKLATNTWGIETVHLSEAETNTNRFIVTARTEDVALRQILAETQRQEQSFDGTEKRKPTDKRTGFNRYTIRTPHIIKIDVLK